MAIARIPSQTSTGTSGPGTTSATYPAPPKCGNLLIAVMSSDGGANSIVGWTTVANINNTLRVSIFTKIATGNETVITSTSNAIANVVRMTINEYGGFFGNAILGSSVTFPNTAVTISTGTTPSTSSANVLLFAAASIAANNTLSSWSNSFTAVSTMALATNSLYTADLVVSTVGAYTTTATTSPTSALNAGLLVAIMCPEVKINNYQFIKVGDGMSSGERIR